MVLLRSHKPLVLHVMRRYGFLLKYASHDLQPRRPSRAGGRATEWSQQFAVCTCEQERQQYHCIAGCKNLSPGLLPGIGASPANHVDICAGSRTKQVLGVAITPRRVCATTKKSNALGHFSNNPQVLQYASDRLQHDPDNFVETVRHLYERVHDHAWYKPTRHASREVSIPCPRSTQLPSMAGG